MIEAIFESYMTIVNSQDLIKFFKVQAKPSNPLSKILSSSILIYSAGVLENKITLLLENRLARIIRRQNRMCKKVFEKILLYQWE